ncbi:heme-binding protein (plasmid) [Burkholderia cenocepacia]|uniref:GlcG/HbpS family heme-binding protein n=1 Tax=Burkholderia cenocepacia TaxID=95486 RepID=UPI001F482018|nr:heme-binding protein [Burkholderia cenocepacia]UJH76199.1 heme-binding protein [Burkholderia cenocepacia]
MLLEHITEVIISRAFKAADNLNATICISIVDKNGLLCGFRRMADVIPGAIDVAFKKARTASLFRIDTDEIGKVMRPDNIAYTLEFTNGGLIGFGGGVVIYDNAARVLGAVGVSGATPEIDNQIALKAAGRE